MTQVFDKNGRVAGGFWRRGGETPSAVKREDRIIEIREGSWSYLAGTIGRLPGMLSKIFILLVMMEYHINAIIVTHLGSRHRM